MVNFNDLGEGNGKEKGTTESRGEADRLRFETHVVQRGQCKEGIDEN